MFLYELHVAKAHRKQGIARTLVQMVGEGGVYAFSASGQVRPLPKQSNTLCRPPTPHPAFRTLFTAGAERARGQSRGARMLQSATLCRGAGRRGSGAVPPRHPLSVDARGRPQTHLHPTAPRALCTLDGAAAAAVIARTGTYTHPTSALRAAARTVVRSLPCAPPRDLPTRHYTPPPRALSARWMELQLQQ